MGEEGYIFLSPLTTLAVSWEGLSYTIVREPVTPLGAQPTLCNTIVMALHDDHHSPQPPWHSVAAAKTSTCVRACSSCRILCMRT